MPTKVMILTQFGHGYYIRGTLKRLMGVLAWLKAWWIRFDHGYYIRGTLKRLTDVVGCLRAWWIRFAHRYYIRGTLKRLTGVSTWLKAWWICVGVKQATDQKSMPPLPWWRGNARDFGSIWPQILYPWKFEEADRCFALAPGLVDLCLVDLQEMPAKVVILAQFGHGYYIRGTLKRLMGVLAWLKAWWICRLTDVVAWLKAWWICVSAKQVTDQKSMPLLPRWGGKVVIWLSLATDIISVGL
ncbi:hypothetical protein C8R44DRAFT_748521 [Mycena epipterygia]|nr:hypothetical protein C8R44DRAFT_748521 [Mycena epipterygia]